MLYSVEAMKFALTAIIISLIVHSILFVKLNYDENSNNEIKVSIKLNQLKSLNPTLAHTPTKDIDSPINKEPNKVQRPTLSTQKLVNKEHLNNYLISLAIYLQNKIQYPQKAKLLRQEGVVITELAISLKGKLLNFNLTKPSKHHNLNEHVKLILGQIEKLPKPPKSFSTLDSIKINVPIEFKL